MLFIVRLLRKKYYHEIQRILYILRFYHICRLVLEEYTKNNGFGFYVYFDFESDTEDTNRYYKDETDTSSTYSTISSLSSENSII